MLFKEFKDVKKQLDEGLITEGEFLLKVQLNEKQVLRLVAVNSLPYKASVKIEMEDLDDE